MPLAPELRGDLFVREAVESEQNDLGAVGEPPRATPRKGHRLQHPLLTFGDNDLGRHPWHDISPSGTGLRPSEKMTNRAVGWKADSARVI